MAISESSYLSYMLRFTKQKFQGQRLQKIGSNFFKYEKGTFSYYTFSKQQSSKKKTKTSFFVLLPKTHIKISKFGAI